MLVYGLFEQQVGPIWQWNVGLNQRTRTTCKYYRYQCDRIGQFLIPTAVSDGYRLVWQHRFDSVGRPWKLYSRKDFRFPSEMKEIVEKRKKRPHLAAPVSLTGRQRLTGVTGQTFLLFYLNHKLIALQSTLTEIHFLCWFFFLASWRCIPASLAERYASISTWNAFRHRLFWPLTETWEISMDQSINGENAALIFFIHFFWKKISTTKKNLIINLKKKIEFHSKMYESLEKKEKKKKRKKKKSVNWKWR